MKQFYLDSKNGTLPPYSFIEPRITPVKNVDKDDPSYGLSNWQHPTNSILEGERLIKNI